MIIDAHCHLYYDELASDIDNVIQRANDAGVSRFVCVGTNVENSKQSVKNTVSSSYVSPTGSYKPQTFITKVGIYDENKVLIAIANLATPVKKTEERELTFKLKLDF